LSVDKITVRGIEIPFTQWYVDKSLTTAEFSAALNHTGWANDPPSSGGPAMIKHGSCIGNGSYLCSVVTGSSIISANATTSSVGLNTGETAVIYFKINNGTLTTLDAGATTTVGIFAGVAGGPLSISIVGQS